jgi:Transposase DDE domain
MDRELWQAVLAAVRRAARVVGREHKRRRSPYALWLVVAMYLWCVWHDRPLCWACDRSHYGRLFRPRKLPSVSQFTRRVKEERFQRVLQLVHDELARRGLVTALGYLDGKALTVSPVSKDRDAARGKVSGGWAKGYKLHAYVNGHGRIVVWSVTGLNVAEQSVALELLPHLPPQDPLALLLCDSNYDSAPLHKAAAALGLGALPVTPLKAQGRVKGGSHHPVTLRQMGPGRRELVAAWRDHPHLVRFVLKARAAVERSFGTLVCTGGGLSSLPAWARTLGRVTRWVGAKIILHNARLKVREDAQKLAAA